MAQAYCGQSADEQLKKLVVLPETIIEVVDVLHSNALVDLLYVLCGHLRETHRHCMLLSFRVNCDR